MSETESEPPLVPLESLDAVWFQAAGTRCNLTCTHCFISCSPKNDNFGFLSFDEVERRLHEAAAMGVKEFYFTGGEPFLNKSLVDMLVRTLDFGPATVLTNGLVLKDEWLTRLRDAEDAGKYGLEFRVSIDGPDAATNDPVRGEGTFEKALRGVEMLVAHGFLPILTMTRVWEEADDFEVMTRFRRVLADHGYTRPRIKLLPRLQIGAEADRTEGYGRHDRVTAEMMAGYDRGQLVCSSARLVSDRGVHVCPILLEAPDGLMGQTLAEADRPFALSHGACYTCWRYGAICSNMTVAEGPRSKAQDASRPPTVSVPA